MAIHPVALLVLVLSPFLVACVDDIAFWSDNGHYYQWVPLDTPLNNNDAKTLASSKSHNSKTGYIVTIGSLAEQQFLASYVSQITFTAGNATDYPTIWSGAARTGNQWVWNAAGRTSNPFFDSSTLACFSYCNWNVNATSAFPTTKNCSQIFLNNNNGPTPGTWRSAACTSVSQFLVIEYDESKTCTAGYTYRTSKGWCEDVNECANNPKLCGAGYQCVNSIGAYHCDDIDECTNATICKPGYWCNNTAGGYSCLDINECAQTPSVCDSGYTCQNAPGSYQCTDINECQANSSLCSKGYTCRNTPGNYSCDDIDECQLQATQCTFGTKCANTIGSYTCDSLYYQIQSQYNTSLVLDFIVVQGICRIVTAIANTATSQLWSFTPEGFIVNGANGYVVDAEGGLVYPGIKAILWPRKRIEEATNQLWDYDAPTNFWYASNYNVVLDIYHGQITAGAEICLFTPKTEADSTSNVNQKWNLLESAQKP